MLWLHAPAGALLAGTHHRCAAGWHSSQVRCWLALITGSASPCGAAPVHPEPCKTAMAINRLHNTKTASSSGLQAYKMLGPLDSKCTRR